MSSASSKSIHGTWHGTIRFGNAPIDIVLRIDASGPKISGLSDFPQHRRADIPLRELSFDQDTLRFATRSFGDYTGTLAPDRSRIDGRFVQDDKHHDLVLHAGVPAEKPPERPQTPQSPFPYQALAVGVDNPAAGCRLAGTLTLPDARPLRAVVLLITGSGAMDRDETVFGHKPFWVIADFLSRHGYAVLRLDDRGVGESTGDRTLLTLDDEVDDMAAAVEFLGAHEALQGLPVGVIGHSMGGLVAATLAARRTDVACVITMGTPGMSLGEAFAERECAELANTGLASAAIEKHRRFTLALYEWLAQRGEAPLDSAQYAALAEQSGALETAAARNNAEWIGRFNTPWFRSAARCRPADVLQQMAAPFLAINGSLDVQTPSRSNLAAIAQVLATAGHADFETRELDGLNHLFQTATTGAVYEYPLIEETFAPAALHALLAWLDARCRSN